MYGVILANSFQCFGPHAIMEPAWAMHDHLSTTDPGSTKAIARTTSPGLRPLCIETGAPFPESAPSCEGRLMQFPSIPVPDCHLHNDCRLIAVFLPAEKLDDARAAPAVDGDIGKTVQRLPHPDPAAPISCPWAQSI